MEKFIVKISKSAQVDKKDDKTYIVNQGWQPLSGIAHDTYAEAQEEAKNHQPTVTSVYQIDKVLVKEV